MQKLVETILLVLFAFTLETALQTSATGLAAYASGAELLRAVIANPAHFLSGIFQWIAFVITLCRFFFGAYRFHTEANVTTPRGELMDAAMSILLFIAFYMAALLLVQRELFVFAMVFVHVVDLLWFVIPNPVPPHIEAAGRHYATYDVITIGVLICGYVGFVTLSLPIETLTFWTGLVLVIMWVIDIKGPTRNWYFDPDQWKRDHTPAITAALGSR